MRAAAVAGFAVAFAALWAGGAAAQQQEQRAAPAGPPAAQASAPKHKLPPRRRSVQQIIATVPLPGYGPVLQPRAALPAFVPPPASAVAPAYSSPPAQINSCSGALCTDTAGNSHSVGVGSAAVNREGRLCNRVGTTMQCF